MRHFKIHIQLEFFSTTTATTADESTIATLQCETWNPPTESTAPCPVLYRSFDNADGLMLMERTTSVSTVPIVSGKVHYIYGCLIGFQ